MLSTRWCALVALVLLAMAAAATATVTTGVQMSAAEGDALAALAQHSESPLAAHAVAVRLDAATAADGEDGDFAALAELESELESESAAPAKTAKKAKAKAPPKANKAKKAKATPAKAKAAKAKAAKPAKATKAKTAKATTTKAAKTAKPTKATKAKSTKAAKSAKTPKTTKAPKPTKAAKTTKAAKSASAKSTKTTAAAKSTKAAKASSKSSKAAKASKSTGAKAAKASTTKATKASKLSADTKKAAKKTNPKLTAAENAAKYTRYRKLHPRRVRNAKAELAVFSANRARIVALNAKLGTSKRRTPFRSVGPFANLSPKDFKKKFLNAKHPRHRKNKRAVPAPATKAVKGGKAPVRKAAKTVVKATTKAKAKATTATKAKAKTTTATAKVSSLKKRATTTKKTSSSKKKSFLEVHADEEYQSLLESAAENGVDAAALARAELAAEAFAEAWESAEMGSWVQVQLEADAEAEAEADAQAPTLPTTTRSAGAGRKVGNGKDVGKGGTRGGNGQDVGKGGTRGGNGQDVGKGGTRGGNGQDVGKGGTRGGNGQEVGKGGTRGGNGEDVGKGGTRGGNGEDVGKGGTRGGNGEDAGKGGTRGGNGDDLIVNDFDGVEALPPNFVPRPTTRAQVVASLTKAGASQAQLDFVFHNTKEIGMIRSGKVVDQGTCGSCWAQTASNTIGMQRGRYFQSLARVIPSVQQLLDCVQTKESGGCAGGTPMDALEWMSTNRVSPAHDYPMREDGASGTCRIAPGGVDQEFRSWGWQPAVPVCEDSNPNCNNQQLQEIALLDQLMQAVSIPISYVDATNWQMYDGGILDTQLCSSTLEAGNHVVELTGVASDPVTGVPYWYLRNSWGEKWGEKGLIRVPFGVNACGLANWVVVPIPPPFIQGRTQEETRARAAASGMSSDPRNVMPANEQLPMPDKATAAAIDAIKNPKRPTVVQSRDAGIIVDTATGIKYNSLNGAWFDPSKGGWTTVRPKAAPANMGPGSAAATASKDAATAVHTTPSLQEAQALKAGVLYDSARDLWFDPKMGKWTEVIPLNVPDSFRYLKISTQMRTEPTPAEAVALAAGCRKDGSMWMDPDIGGWTATRPRQCPASLEFLKH